jgi:hypothetical protein
MTPGVTVSASEFVFLWERFSASIVAAGKPLPQKKWQLAWKARGGSGFPATMTITPGRQAALNF